MRGGKGNRTENETKRDTQKEEKREREREKRTKRDQMLLPILLSPRQALLRYIRELLQELLFALLQELEVVWEYRPLNKFLWVRGRRQCSSLTSFYKRGDERESGSGCRKKKRGRKRGRKGKDAQSS